MSALMASYGALGNSMLTQIHYSLSRIARKLYERWNIQKMWKVQPEAEQLLLLPVNNKMSTMMERHLVQERTRSTQSLKQTSDRKKHQFGQFSTAKWKDLPALHKKKLLHITSKKLKNSHLQNKEQSSSCLACLSFMKDQRRKFHLLVTTILGKP